MRTLTEDNFISQAPPRIRRQQVLHLRRLHVIGHPHFRGNESYILEASGHKRRPEHKNLQDPACVVRTAVVFELMPGLAIRGDVRKVT